MKKILILETDRVLNEGIRDLIKREGYDAVSVCSIEEGKKWFRKYRIDLVVINADLPEEEGYEFCSWVQNREKTSVLFLTTKVLSDEMLESYEVSVGNYIVKPFTMEALIRKVKVILGRESRKANTILDDGFIYIDLEAGRVLVEGETCLVTPTEFHIIKKLLVHRDTLVTYAVMMEYLSDMGAQFADKHALAVNINRLRKKIETPEHRYINNVYGKGYIWK